MVQTDLHGPFSKWSRCGFKKGNEQCQTANWLLKMVIWFCFGGFCIHKVHNINIKWLNCAQSNLMCTDCTKDACQGGSLTWEWSGNHNMVISWYWKACFNLQSCSPRNKVSDNAWSGTKCTRVCKIIFKKMHKEPPCIFMHLFLHISICTLINIIFHIMLHVIHILAHIAISCK